MLPIWLIGLVHFLSTGIVLRILAFLLPCCIVEYYTGTANLLLWVVVTYFTLPLVKKKFLGGLVQPQNKAVLITGCDTGFGHFLAKRLDSKGYHVFASCLYPSGDGAEALRRSCSKKIQVFGLDITSDESVKEALKFVRDNLGTSELWALVNNAGIHKGFSAEFSSMQDYVANANVNVFGLVRVTKAFLPLIRQSKARIVNVTSRGGRISLPYLTPYLMSKYAAVAFNDCLRREMEPWGVKVISIEPEAFTTQLLSASAIGKHCEETLAALSDDIKADYGENYLKNFKTLQELILQLGSAKIEKVVDDLESAISLQHPNIQYKPARNLVFKNLGLRKYANFLSTRRVHFLENICCCYHLKAMYPSTIDTDEGLHAVRNVCKLKKNCIKDCDRFYSLF